MASSKIMAASRICKAISTRTGRPCRNPAMTSSDFCAMHDDSPRSQELRYRRSQNAGRKPHSIVGKLKDLKLNDSADIATALLKVIREIFSRGDIRTSSDIAVLNGLVRTYAQLEKEAVYPKRMKEIEAWFEINKLKVAGGKTADLKTANPLS